MSSCITPSVLVAQPSMTSNCSTRHCDDVNINVTISPVGVQSPDARSKFSIEEILKPSFGPSRAAQSESGPNDASKSLESRMKQDDDDISNNSGANDDESQQQLVDESSRCSTDSVPDNVDELVSKQGSYSPEQKKRAASPVSVMAQSAYLPYLLNYQLAANYQMRGTTLKESDYHLPFGFNIENGLHFLNPFGHYLTGLYARCYENFINTELQLAQNCSFYSQKAAKENAQTPPNRIDFENSKPAKQANCFNQINESNTAQLYNEALKSKWQPLSDVKDVGYTQVKSGDTDSVPESRTLHQRDKHSDPRSDRLNKDRHTVDAMQGTPDVRCQTSDIRPRYRKPRQRTKSEIDKRPRTAFTTQQLQRLRLEFESCPYLCEKRRKHLSVELQLSESQIKIWFQNKRAKLKKRTGRKNSLALRLMEEGLYNHSTIVAEDSADQDSLMSTDNH